MYTLVIRAVFFSVKHYGAHTLLKSLKVFFQFLQCIEPGRCVAKFFFKAFQFIILLCEPVPQFLNLSCSKLLRSFHVLLSPAQFLFPSPSINNPPFTFRESW